MDTTNLAGSVTNSDYNAVGQLALEADANANPTEHHYDSLGRLDNTLDALGQTTNYSYGVLDQPSSVVAPNGASTGYVYDDLGNLLKETSPDRGVTLYGYDAAGNMTCRADPRLSQGTTCAGGEHFTYTYDALNRLTGIDYPQTGTSPDVSLVWDTRGGSTQVGRLRQVTQTTGTATVTRNLDYDAYGNPTQIEQSVVDGSVTRTFSTSYEYDGNNQVKKITYPSGRVANYTRYANGTIKKITATFNGTTQTVIYNATYEPFGPVKSFFYGNGLVHTRVLDAGYRISDVGLVDSAYWGTWDWYTYGRDGAGNITSAEDYTYTGQTTDYGYDVLNRLTWDSGVTSASPTYTYDGNGNRLSRSATQAPFTNQTLGYLANSNRLDVLNSSSVTRDGMGNVTALGTRSMTYGAAGRLASLTDSTTATTLNAIYNGQGELARSTQTVPDGCTGLPMVYATEYFTFSPEGRLLQLRMENLSRMHQEIIWLDDLPVAQYQDQYDSLGTYQSTELTYLHPDQLGTPRLGTDASQQIVYRYRSDAFGNPLELTGRVVRLRFPGQFTLGVGDIHYNYFRDYDPKTGRYIESDPIGLEGGINTYAYVDDNPLRNADPLGLQGAPSYGTTKCSYYRERCKQQGGIYYCRLAGAICKKSPDSAWTRCVRRCLQEADKGFCAANEKKCTGSDPICVINIHQICWQECLRPEGPPPTFP